MSITFYASGSMMDNVFGATSFLPPSTYYIGLSTTHISTSGSNASEPTTGAYVRVPVINNKSNFSYSSSGSITNMTDITFPESTASWGTILDVGLWDTSASATGNVWFYQALPSPRTIDSNTVITFSASAISISMTN